MHKKIGICFVSSYLPRECGIATFTQSIIDNLQRNNGIKIKVASINDAGKRYEYDRRVIAQINQDRSKTYRKAADIINNDQEIDVVSLQHVFSLFGGQDGRHVLELLTHLKKPVFTTLHMVYSKNKTPNQYEIVDNNYIELTKRIYELSERIIVIIQPMKGILLKEYGFDKKKIITVPHGSAIQTFDQGTIDALKKSYGYEKNKIISTFGLIRPKKGLEYVIHAMPKIVKKYPNALFLILGTRHPNRPKEYYTFLEDEVKRLGLESSVIFKNKFLSMKEITEYLIMTDTFITPYLVPEQTSSGVMAYAMGCGKAIISTPFLFAREVLAKKRGLYIDYESPESIFLAVDFLFTHPEKRKRMEQLVFEYAKHRSWEKITDEYLRIFSEYLASNR